MNNRQRQLLAVCLASMGFGLLGGLVYNVTSQMIRPEKVDLDQAFPDQKSRPTTKGPELHLQNKRPSGPDCVVPPGGGPPVTREFKPC